MSNRHSSHSPHRSRSSSHSRPPPLYSTNPPTNHGPPSFATNPPVMGGLLPSGSQRSGLAPQSGSRLQSLSNIRSSRGNMISNGPASDFHPEPGSIGASSARGSHHTGGLPRSLRRAASTGARSSRTNNVSHNDFDVELGPFPMSHTANSGIGLNFGSQNWTGFARGSRADRIAERDYKWHEWKLTMKHFLCWGGAALVLSAIVIVIVVKTKKG